MLESFQDVLTIKELQIALGIGRTKAYELVRTHAVDSFKIGNRIRIPKRSVVAFIQEGCYNNSPIDGCSLNHKEVSA